MDAKSVTKRGNSIFTEASSLALAIAMTCNHVCTFLSFRESLNLLISIFPITAEMFANSSGHIIRDGDFTAVEGSRMFANAKDYVIEDGNFVASNSTSQVPTPYQAPVNYGTAQGNAPPRSYQGQQGKSERLY